MIEATLQLHRPGTSARHGTGKARTETTKVET